MMPAKKRADQTKRASSTSPTTSTSHASVDQHHRLRHSGPSISARRSSAASVPPVPDPTPEIPPTHSRDKKLLAEVSPPVARSPFTKFLYVLFCVLLLFGWYLYGMITLLEKLKEEVGWWGIITGDTASPLMRWETPVRSEFGSDRPGMRGGRTGAEGDGELENSLNALADALGILPVQVASAVRPLIPLERLTSIASKSEKTGGSEAVKILFEDTRRDDADMADASRIAREFAERLGRSAAEENVAETDAMV